MYDFLVSNDLAVVDFQLRKTTKYTYFSCKSNIFTWIDHVARNVHDLKNVTYYQNTSHDPGNVSDHLPVTCRIIGSICPPNVTSSGRLHTAHVPLVTIKWDASGIKAKYFDCLQAKLNDLPLYDGNNTIDHHVQQLNEAMRDAAQSAGCVPRRVFKPKPYWCPELSQLRDRKWFWWKIWVENGRPLHGAVFDCYKGIKKLFRKLCRRKITNIDDNEFHNIYAYFKARKMSSFWNRIKNKRQKQRINSSLDPHRLAEYYRGTMGSDNTPLTPCQCQINNVVKDAFHEWVGSPQHTAFTNRQTDWVIDHFIGYESASYNSDLTVTT